VGRFLSVDPLAKDFAAWSAYNYVLGNPILLVDPDGRAPQFPPPTLPGFFIGFKDKILRGLGYIEEGDSPSKAAFKATWDDLIVVADNATDEVPVIGEVKAFVEDGPSGIVAGLIPGGRKIKKGVEKVLDGVKTTKKVEKTSKAARREAMRDAGIPTSQPLIPDKASKSKDKVFLTRDKKHTVQDAKNDISHKGQPHWEAGPTKSNVNNPDGLNRSGTLNGSNKPQMSKPKEKVYYE